MWPRNPLASFVLSLVLIYGALAIPWPGVGAAYGAVYRGVSNAVFGTFGGDGVVQFRKAPPEAAPMDTSIVLRNRRSPATGTTPNSSRLTGYLVTVELIALVLATPVPWPRRRRALIWGLVLIHLFIGFRLWLTLVRWFSGDAPWCLFQPGPFWQTVLARSFEALVVSPTPTFVVPLFVWLLVTYRKDDWEQLLLASRIPSR